MAPIWAKVSSRSRTVSGGKDKGMTGKNCRQIWVPSEALASCESAVVWVWRCLQRLLRSHNAGLFHVNIWPTIYNSCGIHRYGSFYWVEFVRVRTAEQEYEFSNAILDVLESFRSHDLQSTQGVEMAIYECCCHLMLLYVSHGRKIGYLIYIETFLFTYPISFHPRNW